MQAMPAIKSTYKQTRIEYVPGMNKYSNLLEDVTEKELLITLVRIFNFLEKDIALLFENNKKNDEKLKNQTHKVKQDLVAELATKADIEELKGDNRELAAKVDAQIQELKLETKADIKELKLETKTQIKEIKGDIKELAVKVDAQIRELSAKTDTKVEEIKGGLKSIKILIKVLIGTLLVSISFFSPNTIEFAKFIGKLFGK